MGNVGVQHIFFRTRGELKFLGRYQPEGDSQDFINVDPFFAAIIANGKASLKELKTELTLEDAYDLWEIVMTTNFNQWLAVKRASDSGR